MSDLNPPSQSNPGGAPERTRTAMVRASGPAPASTESEQELLITSLIDSSRVRMGRIRRKLGGVFRRKPASNARGTQRLTRTKMNASSNSPHHAGSEERLPVASRPGERRLARSLAGATTLQIIPMLNDEPPVRAALRISGALLRAGARSLIASGGGALVSELHAQGGEWIQFPNAHVNRWSLGRCARALE